MNARQFLENWFEIELQNRHEGNADVEIAEYFYDDISNGDIDELVNIMEVFARYQMAQFDSFDQILREEFLLNSQKFPKEYRQIFQEKYERAERRYKEQNTINFMKGII